MFRALDTTTDHALQSRGNHGLKTRATLGLHSLFEFGYLLLGFRLKRGILRRVRGLAV